MISPTLSRSRCIRKKLVCFSGGQLGWRGSVSGWKGWEEAFCGDKEGSWEEQSQWKMFSQTRLIRPLRSFWPRWSWSLYQRHFPFRRLRVITSQPPTAGSLREEWLQTAAHWWSVRNMKRLHRVASSQCLNLVFLQPRADLDNLVAFIWKNDSEVYCYWMTICF